MSDLSAIPQERFWRFVNRRGPDECWEWTRLRNKDGYGRFCAYSTSILAHRIAFALANGYDPGPALVCHECDNPSCCNPRHLWLGDDAANKRDSYQKGRHVRGERFGGVKLTEAQVLRIMQDGRSERVVGKEYGVSPGAVGAIRRGRNWRYLTGYPDLAVDIA